MAKKSVTKSKPANKQVKKYQFAGANYQQVTNPYYISGTFAEQAAQQTDRLYGDINRYGQFATSQAEKEQQAIKEEQARLKSLRAESKAASDAETRQASTDALLTGVNLTKNFLSAKAAAGAAATSQAAGATGAAAGAGAGAATGAGAAAGAAGTGASLGTGLATAGVGLGLNVGGMFLEKSGDDNDFTTFTEKEKRRNLAGSAMKSAGTGVGIGAGIGSIIPGVGTVVGGAIGGAIGAGVGAIKGLKENKESKQIAEDYKKEQEKLEAERKQREAEINAQGNLLAQRYNTAFVNSRLTGMQTGFGYNTSTNMNMQPTSSFYAKTGGKLPGGHMVPIGDDAIKFVGRKHSEGGIKLDPKTEVEGGETMDKVMMSGGKPNDYFFSAYLKLGGKSFAKRHEELIKAGASQKEIQDLAKKQEAVANKKGEKHRGPEQIAKYGGIHKYQTAGFEKNESDAIDFTPEQDADGTYVVKDASGNILGKSMDRNIAVRKARASYSKPALTSPTPQQSADAQSNSNASNVTVRDQNQVNATAPSAQQSVAPGGTTNNAGQAGRDAAANVGTKDSSATATSAEGTPVTKVETTANTNFETKAKGKDSLPFSNPNTAGDDIWKGNRYDTEWIPWVKSATATDDQVKAVASRMRSFSADPKVQNAINKRLDSAGNDIGKLRQIIQDEGTDRQVGPFHRALRGASIQPAAPAAPAVSAPPADTPKEAAVPPVPKKEEDVIIADLRKGVNGSVLAGLGQLIPVGYALARPYRTEGNLPRMQNAGNVGAGSVKGAVLPRVNMNAERAAAERNTVAVKNAIQNANAGPGAIAAMMAANTAQNNQMLTIANQEQEANKQLAAEEARLGQQASQFNAETAQRASMANVQNRLAVSQANLEAGIQERKLKIDEKRYKREEILGALDSAASRIAGIVKDEKSYKAQERLAKAIDATGSYDRFTIYEQLQKESKKKSSPYYGKTDAELRKIAADTHNYYVGKVGEEAETKKLGGARRYTSRLGDLNRGRNKRKFNI